MAFEFFSDNASSLLNILGRVQTFQQGLQGQRYIERGTELEAGTLRATASTTKQITNFNSSIQRINLNRQLAAEARAVERNLSTYRATAAGRGFSSSSKTFMAFASQELALFEKRVQQSRVSQGHEETAANFEAEARATALESQARMAEFRGQQQARQTKPNLLAQGAGLLGAVGSLFSGSDDKTGGLF